MLMTEPSAQYYVSLCSTENKMDGNDRNSERKLEMQEQHRSYTMNDFDCVNSSVPKCIDEYYMGNDSLEFIPYSSRPETYIVPIVFSIIFIIGILGNGTLIAIFIKHKSLFSVPNMYICSLAIGDILVILFCVPFTSTVYTLESWPYGTIVCKFSEFIKDVSIGVSVFTLTALSADRYFAIADPMKKLTGRRATLVTILSIIGIWSLSISLALPSVIFSYVRIIDSDPSKTFLICYPFPPELGDLYPQVVVLLKFLAYYAIPLILIAVFYIIMARHLIISTKGIPGEARVQARQTQARKKVAKMVLSFVVIFALCFLPSHVFLLWFYFHPSSEEDFNEFWNILRIFGFCLGFCNSCINPLTLYCLSGTFRKYFNQHLFCCVRREEIHSSQIPAFGSRLGQNSKRDHSVLECGCNRVGSMRQGPRAGRNREMSSSWKRCNNGNSSKCTLCRKQNSSLAARPQQTWKHSTVTNAANVSTTPVTCNISIHVPYNHATSKTVKKTSSIDEYEESELMHATSLSILSNPMASGLVNDGRLRASKILNNESSSLKAIEEKSIYANLSSFSKTDPISSISPV